MEYRVTLSVYPRAQSVQQGVLVSFWSGTCLCFRVQGLFFEVQITVELSALGTPSPQQYPTHHVVLDWANMLFIRCN